MAEPERALSLLDGAESKKTIPLRIIHELRSRVYRNMYMTKLAFCMPKSLICWIPFLRKILSTC